MGAAAAVVGHGLTAPRRGLCRPVDLGLELPDGLDPVACQPRELAASMMLRLREQGLAVPFAELAAVDRSIAS